MRGSAGEKILSIPIKYSDVPTKTKPLYSSHSISRNR